MKYIPELELKFNFPPDLFDLSSADWSTANMGTRPGIVGRKKGADFYVITATYK